jgi:ABC-type transport system involved in multi-copper enzyme maturation permease subunit
MSAATAAVTWRRGRLAPLRDFVDAVATIMVKELRSRMRGRRAFVVLTLYLAILAAIAYGAYLVTAPSARLQGQVDFDPFGVTPLNASASIGQAIFTLLSLFQLLLVCFIAPAFTAGAISLEREKQTLDLLVSTPLRPGGIVVGKLVAALAFVFLMIVAGLPVSALVLMYGGVTVDDLLRQQVVLFASALGFGAIGLFFSALVKRTQAATVLTYSSMLALTIGSVLIYIFWSQMLLRGDAVDAFATNRAPDQLLWVNPGVAMAEVIANTETTGRRDFSRFLYELRPYSQEIVCQDGVCFPSDEPMPMPVPGIPQGEIFVPEALEKPGRDTGLGGGIGIDDLDAKLMSRVLIADGPAADCPPNARCLPDDAARVPEQQTLLVYSHFWPRFAVTFPGLSVLLTLASMWLVIPSGMRFAFRRRRSERSPAEGDATLPGAPVIEPLEGPTDR